MCFFQKTIILSVAVLLAGSCLPANAFMYLGGDEVLDELGVNYDYDDGPQNQQQRSNQNNNNKKVLRPVAPPQFISKSANPDITVTEGNLQMCGVYVGNMQYKVGQAGGALYLVDRKGQVSSLAAGTVLENIALPFDNPFVQSIMNSQPVPGPETQARAAKQKNGGGGRFVSTPGLLTPTYMATRTMVVNGQAMIVGGPIISEYRQAPVVQAQPQIKQASYARVIPTVKRKVRKRVAN